jgi:hypothetical protein
VATRSAPVAAGHHHPRGLAPLTTAPDVAEEAVTHFALPFPPFGHAPPYSAPRWLLLHPSLLITDKPP